jgi:hypothetical protein
MSNLKVALEVLNYADQNKVTIAKASQALNVSEKTARYVRSTYDNKNDPAYQEFIRLYNKVLENQTKSVSETLKQQIDTITQEFEPTDSLLDKDDVIEKEQLTIESDGRTKTLDYRGNLQITTLEDLIKETKIDLELWNIDRHIVNKWDTTFVDKATGQAEISQNFQVKAFMSIKQNAIETFNANEVFKQLLAEYKPIPYKKIKYETPRENNLLEINIFDLHLGKLCWAGETGENYDVKIASKRFMEAITKLIARASSSEFNKILFPVGNDFFNSDTILNTTTEGTPQDEDLRWQKTFKLGVQLLVQGIDYMRQYAPVDVVIIPGNHDMQRCFFLGETLSAWYRNAEDVNVDNGAALRKYYRYGKVLIGLTHGNNEKEASLGHLMTRECRKLLAETDYWEWHLGHFHKKKAVKYPMLDENLGITIRYMSSLSGTDGWHFKKGYVGTAKAAEAYLWNYDSGYIGQFNINIIVADEDQDFSI